MHREHSRQRPLSRRDFIRASAAAAASPAFAFHTMSADSRRRKPNLLFLWTDEQRADTMAAYGNHEIHAPNLNKLASESVVFQHAYVSQPICTPSRSTVMTGLWPHTTGCTENNIPLPLDTPTLPELVNDPDYRTGYFGKWHLGDEVFLQHGVEEWQSIEDMYWKFYREHRDADHKSSYYHFLRELGYEPDTERGDFSRGFAARLPIEHCKPKFLELQACDFLRRHRSEPFILYVNFLEPHMPFYGPLDDEHDPAQVNLPDNFDDPLEANEPETYRRRREAFLKDGYGGHDLTKEADWRRLIANYWGLVTQVDRSVGAILEALEKLGLADETIVVYTSDHGDMMGSHHLLTKGFMYEEAVRVPWLMRVPQLGLKSHMVNNPVSQTDMVPTLLDLMHVGQDDRLPGQSLQPLLEGRPVGDDYVHIEWTPAWKVRAMREPGPRPQAAPGSSTRTVVSRDGWKLCLNDRDSNQLFDLNRDPGETTNVYDAPEHKDVITKLVKRIRAWQERVQDEFPVNV